MPRNISVLQWIRRFFPRERSCRVALNLESAIDCNNHERTLRVSSKVLATLTKWGWEWTGDFEKVDRSHPFSDEKKWLEWLLEDDRRRELLDASRVLEIREYLIYTEQGKMTDAKEMLMRAL